MGPNRGAPGAAPAPGGQDHHTQAGPAAQKREREPSRRVPSKSPPRCQGEPPRPSRLPAPSSKAEMNGRGAGIGRGRRAGIAARHKGGAGGRAPPPVRTQARRSGQVAANDRLPSPRGPAGQRPSRPRAPRGEGPAPPPHRELFLLLGSTPLKVVVVVMAPRSEVGWRRSRALKGSSPRGSEPILTQPPATAAGASTAA